MSRWRTQPGNEQGALFPYPPEFFYVIGPISLLIFWDSADELFSLVIPMPIVYGVVWCLGMLADFPRSISVFVSRSVVMLFYCGCIAIKWIWFLDPN